MILKQCMRVAILVAAIFVAGGAYIGGLQLTGNFAEVIPGEFYRSAQPSPQDIAYYAEQYGIKTILNLRGQSTSAWHRDELAAAQATGIKLIDFRMSASRPLTLDQTKQLISLMRDAPKPILIHCKSGADRTGLVSVIYMQQIVGADEATAERQLSLRYGHLSIPLLAGYAMDRNWEELEKHFGLSS